MTDTARTILETKRSRSAWPTADVDFVRAFEPVPSPEPEARAPRLPTPLLNAYAAAEATAALRRLVVSNRPVL